MTSKEWEILQEVRSDVKLLLADRNKRIGITFVLTSVVSIIWTAIMTIILEVIKFPH